MIAKFILVSGFIFFGSGANCQQQRERARDLGISFDGKTGPLNAITDVPGIMVGYKTLISGDGELVYGKGPVRTGVTVILPKGKTDRGYPAAIYSLNGDGEMTGIPYVEDYGMGFGPIGITNTNSVGIVRDAIGKWSFAHFSDSSAADFSFGLPIVAETWDGLLNDINGFHVKESDVNDALNDAHGGKIAEGNVGGGTGMGLYGFKGGNGTASRIFKIDGTSYTLGVFIQANFGGRQELRISGVPAGKEIKDLQPVIKGFPARKDGSAIVIVATDAPLLPSQLKQVAKRVAHGIARTGTISHESSGEIFLALSTATPAEDANGSYQTWKVLSKEKLDAVYKATTEATEEAIINALVAAEDMKGINGNILYGIPHARLREVIKKYVGSNLSEER